jgi:large repetitive protein
MRIIALAAITSVNSLAKQLQRVLLLSALLAIATVNSWGQITVSPASITFAKQLITTTSGAKVVTITNNGASAQPIVITMSGDFTETDNCSGSVAAGGSCSASLFFTPTLVGAIKGAASIYDNSNNLLAFVGLTATGGAPVTAAPATLNFTGGTIGTQNTQTLTFKITNAAPTPTTVNTITPSSNFTLSSTGTCLTTPLAAKTGNCTVSVQVKPTAASNIGSVIITDNAANGLPLVVKLTSAATGGPTTPITLSKSALTFTTVSGGTSATQTITVTNTSGSVLTLGTISASTYYGITSTTCGSTLAISGTCTFGINFSPTFVGSIAGSAAISYTGNNSPQLVNLTGTSKAQLTAAPATLAFGSAGVGSTTVAKAVKITNNTTSAITLNTIAATGDFGIQLSGTTCVNGFSLLAGKFCTLNVTFSPTIAAAIVGSVTVTNTGSPNPLLIALGGTGTNTASASLNPASAHQGSSQTIVITGTGTSFGPTTTVSFGSNITTGTLTVNGPTSMSVPITIDNAAVVGSRTVTITTGSQVVKPSFTVIAGVPAVTLINPNTIQPTQTESVAVTGAFTTWVNGTTKASFGPGIAVGGGAVGGFGPVTVTGATTLTASLVTSGATAGFRTVQIQTGTQTLSVTNGLDVETCTSTSPTVLSISPANGASNMPLNAQVQIQFSVPMKRSTLSQLGNTAPATVFFWDASTSLEIPGTISVDASGTIATITPSTLLPAGRTFYTYWGYAAPVQDACNNNLGAVQYSFNTAYSTDTTGPVLTGTSPVSGDTNIPLNGNATGGTPVVLQFDSPIDPVTAQAGFSVTKGGTAVLGNFTFSTDDRTVTFTPISALTSSTSYTVNYTAQITDTTGSALTNPGSFSFTTGTAGDSANPSVTAVDPQTNTFGVGLNVTPHVTFSEPVNELTVPGNFNLYYQGFSSIIPATVTVAPNRLSATITPSAQLLPSTLYYLYICGYTNIAGNTGNCFQSYFYTGNSTDTNATTVTSINPINGQTGVPINTQVAATMSDDIDPTSVNNSSITVKQGSTTVAGTVTLATNGTTLTFVPSAPLSVSTLYNVTVGGFKDTEGNAVTAFNSSFTTGTGGYANGSFSLVSTSPASGATGVSVTSPVTFTMTNLINGASVTPSTVEVYIYNTSEILAGSYSVSGATVTFTPLSPYPANTTIGMYIYGLTDEAGNAAYNGAGSFVTTNTLDHTAPTVTISPSNGATNVGLNSQVVLTFSKSINTSTINQNTLALFNGDTSINYGYTLSPDNRTIVINQGGSAWPSGATLTVELTTGIQDLSGNALANTTSQFTVTTALSTGAPSVISMRPAGGATNVPASTVITLFTNSPMNPSSIAGALHITDNGVVVSGSVQLFSNAQAIVFTPGGTFTAGDLIQVHLDSSALSASNVPLSAFSSQFTVAGSLASVAATVQATNPFPSATTVPLNSILQIAYNEALDASTINSTNVVLYQYSTGTFLTPTLSLVNGGQVINVVPTSNLVAGSGYFLYVDYGGNVKGTNGLAVQAYELTFTAGSAADTAPPTIVSQAPTNNSTNIATNALVSVNFNKAINPISVTGSTIQLTAGTTTEVPSSISFSPDFTRVSVTPQAPLPPSTVMTYAINGVTSQAGKPVAATTTHFTTAAQPNFAGPFVVSSSVLSSQTNVPVNSAFSMTFNEPIDIGSYNVANVNVYGYHGAAYGVVPATVSWSTDQTTVFIVPTSPLNVGSSYYLESYNLVDLSGNPQQGFTVVFTTSFAANTNPPTVINTSPENTQTQVPSNAPVQILFSEPIQPSSLGAVTLTTGGNPIAVTMTFGDANQLLTLRPNQPLLSASSTYTLTITGVKDTAGNVMAGTVTTTFTTGSTFDIVGPQVTGVDPVNGTMGVGINVTPHVQFNERINPLSMVSSSNELFNSGSVELYNLATSQYVPATVSMSADRMSATLTPSSALQPNTSYQFLVAYGQNYYDVAGNYGGASYTTFVTGSGSDTTHTTISTISPVNAQTGVPQNVHVVAVASDDIDPTTVNNSSITVTPSGGSAISGTVTLATDQVTLTFVPSAVLNPTTVYNVSVGGFKDTEGNTATTFNSSFTTGSGAYSSFSLISTTPVSGATGVSVTSPVTFTMNNLINAASVNPTTVEVYVYNTGQIVAGTYSASGAAVTFTPVSPYPASTLMGMYIYGLTDEAGNAAYTGAGTFTTTNTVDSTAPTVTITPANGATNAGLNTQVVLTFSKSINPSTITSSSVNLLNGDRPINPATSISKDNRTVVLNYNGGLLPAGATITVTANSLVTDLSGNALVSTTSQFTTTPAVSNSAPYVISMRPGSGATAVPTNAVITLFTSAPMNSSSVTGALEVSQTGVLVAGTTTVGSNGQSIQFKPTSALPAGTTIQVNLTSTAQDIYGNYLSNFSGTFTTVADLTTVAATVTATNPFPSATNVPLNSILQIAYNEPIDLATLNNTNVVLYQYSTATFLTPTLSLVGGGQVINVAPTSNLIAGSGYFLYVDYGGNVKGTNGVVVQAYQLTFTAGSATDTVAPTITAVAPPDTATNIGTNAGVSVTFNKAINPVSVTGSTIQLSGGSVTEVPSSISFTSDYTRTIIIPQAALPGSTSMAIAINGVTGEAGTAVASQTTHFTTMAGADFYAPSVVNASVGSGQTVGTNAAFAMQFNKPMDPGSVNPGGVQYVYLYDYTLGYVAFSVSFSADQTAVILTPTATLGASHQFQMCSSSMMDLSGNPQQGFCVGFFTGSGTDTTGPSVLQVSPPSGFTGVPINSPVQILFNEPISGASIGGVTLKQGSSVVPITASVFDGNRGIQLQPLVPLAASTVYTINVTGVKDISGNTQTSFPSQSFTTGTGTDLLAPTIVSTTPVTGATNVAVTTTVKVVFSEAMDPASFDPNTSFVLYDPSTKVVPATITFSADYKTVTLQPTASLTGGGATYYMYIGYFSPVYDLGGNPLGGTYITFNTH